MMGQMEKQTSVHPKQVWWVPWIQLPGSEVRHQIVCRILFVRVFGGSWISVMLHSLPYVSPCDSGPHHVREQQSIMRGGRLEGE